MDQPYQAQLSSAKLLAKNHWLAHARQKCQESLAVHAQTTDDTSEAVHLLQEIEQRLRDPSALNLSRDHTPVAVFVEKELIISTLHFRHLETASLKQEAFRQAVSQIDLETSSRCNRKCQYCPNSTNDRFSSNQFMDDSTFSSFIAGLQAIDYRRDLHLVGYNEPLLYIDNLLSRIDVARKALPRARIVVFTNGDFLEKETIDHFIAARVDEVRISVHLPIGRAYNDQEIFTRINKIAKRLGTPIEPLNYIKDVHILARLVREGIRITIYQTDYKNYGSNRASTLDDVGPQIDVRTAACLLPINQFIVGHKGAVVPCCVMVSDDPRNSKYIVGSVDAGNSIFDTYCNPSFVAWRRSLFNLAPKKTPCHKCANESSSPLLNAAEIYEPWQHLVAPPLVSPVVLR